MFSSDAAIPETVHVAAKEEAVQKPLRPSLALDKFSAHHYAQSPSGVDSNLLILLHGLGDSDSGFFNLGKNLQKTIPQTAVLTLQAPLAVPFLDPGQHWMWYPAFDQMGELLTKPNPSAVVKHFIAVLHHLVGECGWRTSSIHLFGFGQGATVALETLVAWTRTHSCNAQQALGSVVSISGELISHPTLPTPSSTPVLHVYRAKLDTARDASRWASLRKATSALTLQRLDVLPDGGEEAMVRGSEWDVVMQFWAKLVRNRSAWEREGKVVELG